MMENVTLAFIGTGNMATSLIGGLIDDGFPASSLWVSGPTVEKLAAIQARFAINTTTDNQEAASKAQVAVLAVKPQVLPVVAKELAGVVQANHCLVISIAAGVRHADLSKWMGKEVAIVRCIPNTPALVGSSATGLCANDYVSAEQQALAESVMRAVGITQWLKQEEDMDTVTALSGSGPAYFFLIMEALEAAAVAQGLEQQTAHLLTIQTALGAAKMALRSDVDLAALRDQVTSPGGTTEQALQVLESGNIRELLTQAIAAAKARAQQLAKAS